MADDSLQQWALLQQLMSPASSAGIPDALPTDKDMQKNPYLKESLGNINRLHGLLAMEGEQRAKQGVGDYMNFTPLANLADYENAKQGLQTNLGKGYQVPMTAQDMQDKLFAREQGLQKDREGVIKGWAEGQRAKALTNRSDAIMARFKLAQEKEAGHQTDIIEQDPIILASNQGLAQISKDRALVSNPNEIVSPQVLSEITKGLANIVAGKGGATLHDTENQEIKNLETEAAKLKQYLTSKPANALQEPATRQMLIHIMDRLEKSNRIIIEARTRKRLEGKNFSNNPNIQSALQAKLKGNTAPPEEMHAPVGNMVEVIAPDGTMGSMPADKLDAAMKQGFKKK